MKREVKIICHNFGDDDFAKQRLQEYCRDKIYERLGFYLRLKKHQLNKSGQNFFKAKVSLKIYNDKRYALYYELDQLVSGKLILNNRASDDLIFKETSTIKGTY